MWNEILGYYRLPMLKYTIQIIKGSFIDYLQDRFEISEQLMEIIVNRSELIDQDLIYWQRWPWGLVWSSI